VDRSGKLKGSIALVAGFPHYTHFYDLLRAERVRATALNVARLKRVADVVDFPRDEIFLDDEARR
jgi:hypothetical protein